MTVWLQHGLSEQGALVCVEDVSSGRTALHCPYCTGELTARKGRKLAHHFAHTHQTCAAVAERSGEDLPLLPLYTEFTSQLGKHDLAELIELWQKCGAFGYAAPQPQRRRLVGLGYLSYNDFAGRSGGYEFTKLGKIPVGGLSVPLFSDIQKEHLLERLYDLEDTALYRLRPSSTICHLSFPQALGDYRLYRAQLQRVLAQQLYYLKIETAGACYYKIGVTRRRVEERIAEIKAELAGYVGAVEITLLGCWQHCGRVEHYFKHRFSESNQRIGSLGEYFCFERDQAKKVLRELRRLKSKQELSADEATLLEPGPSLIEREVEALKVAYQQEEARIGKKKRRSQAIRRGMKRAAQGGQHVGRPKAEEAVEAFLAKPKSRAIAAALSQQLSLRETAKQTGVSVNTVRKVKTLLSQQLSQS